MFQYYRLPQFSGFIRLHHSCAHAFRPFQSPIPHSVAYAGVRPGKICSHKFMNPCGIRKNGAFLRFHWEGKMGLTQIMFLLIRMC